MDIELAKLNKLKSVEDWPTWKFQVKVLMIANECYSIAEGTELKPEPLGINANAAAISEYQKELRKWLKLDGMAQKLIVLHVSEQALLHVIECESAHQMWSKLKSVFEGKTETNVHLLQQKWFSLTREATDDMGTYIAKVRDVAHKLSLLGEPISEKMIMTKILITLPASLSYFSAAWDSTPIANRTLDNLVTRLITEERRSSMRESEPNSALVVKRANSRNTERESTRGQNKQKQAKPGACYKCGKLGHFIRDCRSKISSGRKKEDKDAKKQQNSKEKEEALLSELALFSPKRKDSEIWYLDSGASSHMTGRREWLKNFQEFQTPVSVKLGNAVKISAHGRGHINVLAFTGIKWERKYLENVLYVPKLVYNLFSMGSTLDKQMNFKSDKRECRFIKGRKTIAIGERKDKLYEMKLQVIESENAFSTRTDKDIPHGTISDLQLWHERLAHQNFKRIKEILSKRGVMIKENSSFCEACARGKAHKKSFPTSITKTKGIAELIHADLCGPMEMNSIGGSRYFLLFKDDFSGYQKIYFLKSKNEVFNHFRNYVKRVYLETGRKINTLRTDNGLEFVNSEMKTFMKDEGIEHQTTVPYTPEQNGKAEREMRTIVEAARTMLLAKNFPKSLWAEAVNTAVHVLNRTMRSDEKDNSPYQVWFNKDINLNYLKIFGTKCHVHVPKQNRKKWDAKSKEGYFVGYDGCTKGYRIWFPDTKKIETHRDIIFESEQMTANIRKDEKKEQYLRFEETSHDGNTDIEEENEEEENEEENEEKEVFQEAEDEECASPNSKYALRDRRTINPPDRYGEFYKHSLLIALGEETMSYEEVIQRDDSSKWKKAMQEELEALKRNTTWKLVKPPRNAKILDNKWVLKTKNNPDGSAERFKARLVARGFKQKKGQDYDEIFSPVARFESIRTILAIAAVEKMHKIQIDVKTAFLNGTLEEEIYMRQPMGFEDGTGRVCKLQKSLYGLKQAARCWNNKLVEVLKEIGMYPTKTDQSVFTNENCNTILAIYVDDGLLVSKEKEDITRVIKHLKQRFEIKTGELGLFLGMEIKTLKDGTITINQEQYAKKITERFNLTEANVVSVPTDAHQDITMFASDQVKEETTQQTYREAVGSLLFLATVSRPDIAHAVSVTSRFIGKSSKAHWNAVKRIIKYVKGTLNFGLIYKSCNDVTQIQAFSDADYAGDVKDRRSTTGYVLKLGSSTVVWGSQKQSCVALSTTESEYISASQTVKEIIWLSKLTSELFKRRLETPILHIDNQSTIRLIKNPEYHKRTKHIDIRYHFVREKFFENLFTVQYVTTKDQEADIFTKALNRERFQYLRNLIRVKKC